MADSQPIPWSKIHEAFVLGHETGHAVGIAFMLGVER